VGGGGGAGAGATRGVLAEYRVQVAGGVSELVA
jgi:hypothetical protein